MALVDLEIVMGRFKDVSDAEFGREVRKLMKELSGLENAPLALLYRKGVRLPASLATEAFRLAYGEWLDEQRERGLDDPTPRAANYQLAALARMGHDKAIAAIKHSIGQGWKGIFEEKGRSGGMESLQDRIEKQKRAIAGGGTCG